MRVALYARVSTEAQQARGTIASQLEALRARAAGQGDEVVAEFCDDGYSGARLDRPGLDGLRDAAEAGACGLVWCLSPDRLARAYAWQVLVLDEPARLGVVVRFVDAPALDDDPQARLLTQVQGVIAEYERAKIAERYRRGKLWRSRVGEVISWKAPYGYRRVPRLAAAPAHLVVFEPEAQVVRGVFDDYVAAGLSMRQITRRLNADRVAWPTGKPVWGVSTVGRLLRNQAYVGCTYYNRTELVRAATAGRRPTRQRRRPRSEWIAIPVPPIVADDVFEAAQQISRDNRQWSPRRAEPGAWLLRGLVVCGSCGVGVNCHKMRGRNGSWHRYHYCRNHDPCVPPASSAAVPSATSAPTSWTRSCSTRSAPPCSAPRCCWPANAPSPPASPPPTTSCSPLSLPACSASSTPLRPNAAGWSTSTRLGCWSSPRSSGGPPRSTLAASSSPTSRSVLPLSAASSPRATGSASAWPASPSA
jgi:site-specific DNA recombinase